MFLLVDHGGFLLGVVAPQQEDQMIGTEVQVADYLVGEEFPATAGMGSGFVSLDSQSGVQQEDALAGPRLQAAVFGGHKGIGILGSELLVNVPQARGEGAEVAGDREGQSHGLPVIVVRILSEDHHFDLVDRAVSGPRID